MSRMESEAQAAGVGPHGAADAHAVEIHAAEAVHSGAKALAVLRIFALRTAAEGIAHSPRSATRLASCMSSRAWLGADEGSTGSPCAGYADAVRAAQARRQAPIEAAQRAAAKARMRQGLPALTTEQALARWPNGATTVMLRSFPNRYKVEELRAVVVAHDFLGQFDFFYLPMDFSTKRNRGHCFINFYTVDIARRFLQTFHATRRLSQYASRKILEVEPARIQGREAMVAQFGGQHLVF
eukprot:TRINITY_DN2738_c0_g2_i2.p1 TRINITY_DN2738_c0_g2~~TRINITY_DN2738_c0_g2_i2.p1  ORF type:complete len:240 (+),score=43.37 TRINITY_DN2738_c0_g2_i2:117-836(+)